VTAGGAVALDGGVNVLLLSSPLFSLVPGFVAVLTEAFAALVWWCRTASPAAISATSAAAPIATARVISRT
jgi:hypothetical protein